jgi:predicted nucleic acid binding AN1-type Zn finger protein
MEFMNLGKRCSFPNCAQLDFLPFQCKLCKDTFCLDHRAYADHSCPEKLPEAQAISCPLCNFKVIVKIGKDANVEMSRHMETDACKRIALADEKQRRKMKPANPARKAHGCHVRKCKKREHLQLKCKYCSHSFCTKHRFPTDHRCESYTIAPSGRTKPSESGNRSGTRTRASAAAGSTCRQEMNARDRNGQSNSTNVSGLSRLLRMFSSS